MGKLYKRGKKYYGDYEDQRGRRRRVSLGTGDRQVAKAKLRKLELAQADPNTYATQTLLAALDHLTSVAMPAAGRAQGTISCYTEKGRHLIRVLGGQLEISQLEREDVQEYISQRLSEGAANGSVHKELVTLRRALKEAQNRKLFFQDPAVVVPAFSAKYEPRDLFLTPSQLTGLLQELTPRRALWVMVAVFAGLRASEVEGLQWEDVNLDTGWIRVRGTKTDGSFRKVPLLAQLRPWMEQFHNNEGKAVELWTNRRRDIHLACETANVPKVSANDLRRTFASWMKQTGVDSLTVAHMLGHSTTRMVELVYGRLDDATYQDAAKKCAVYVTAKLSKAATSDACENIAPKPKTPQTANLRHSAGFKRVSPARLERATYGFEVRRSIHLSYGPPDATLATGTR
tara:strand:- start:47930 stop:49132 length:1203 start_codon:yes stop_codon:yes gene_type:complete